MFRTKLLNAMLPKPVFLSREQIDAQRWDKHISHSGQCVIYALSWYLDTVCEQWEALVWPSATEFSIVMPLAVRRKMGVRVLYQPLFCQYLGIFSQQELAPAQCSLFLQAVAARYTYVSNYTFNPENFQLIFGVARDLKCFDLEIRKTHWLDLDRHYGHISTGYAKDRNANLKRGARAKWQIIGSDDFERLVAFFVQHHAPHIGKIKKNAYRTLEALGRRCLDNAAGTLLYARIGPCIHAGILLARYRGRTIYLFNSADPVGRKGNARAVMLDTYFRRHAGTKQVFDFESPQKESIAAYYAGFGAMEIPFCCISRNALPFPLRQLQWLRKWLLIRTRRYLS